MNTVSISTFLRKVRAIRTSEDEDPFSLDVLFKEKHLSLKARLQIRKQNLSFRVGQAVSALANALVPDIEIEMPDLYQAMVDAILQDWVSILE